MKARAALYLVFGFGILWHLIPATFQYVLFLTPLALILVYILILYPEVINKNYTTLIWLAAVFILTFIIEVIGVKTGAVFGNYQYNWALGLKVFDVPLLIGLNWGMIIWGSSEISERLPVPAPAKIILTAFLAVAVDLLIEPLSSVLNYWTWSGGTIPFQNYASWFIISLVFAAFYFILKNKAKSDLPVHFYFTQVLFFGVLNLVKF